MTKEQERQLKVIFKEIFDLGYRSGEVMSNLDDGFTLNEMHNLEQDLLDLITFILSQYKQQLVEEIQKERNPAMPSPQRYYEDTPKENVYILGKNDGRHELINKIISIITKDKGEATL